MIGFDRGERRSETGRGRGMGVIVGMADGQ